MADTTAHVQTNRLLRRMTMHVVVHDPPFWRVRLWIAMSLMRLAARVLNVNIAIETRA